MLNLSCCMRFLIWELVVCPLVSIMWLAGVCSPVHTKLHWLQLEMWTLAWLTVIMGQHSNIKLVPANSILSNQTTTANILTAESSEDEQALRNSCELLRKRKDLHTSSWNYMPTKNYFFQANILNHIHGLFAIKL